MTRPLFEPSTQREVAAAQFATQQLFRRPAPSSGAGECRPWIRIGQYSRTFTDSTQALLASRVLQYDPAITNVSGTDFSWTTVNVGEAHDSWLVSTRKQGWYEWDALLIVDIGGTLASDAGGIEFWLTDTAATELSEYYEAWDIFDDSTFTTGWQGEGSFHVHASGFLHVDSSNRQWRFAARQSTGGSIDIGVEWITIWQMCTDDALTWTEETTP